MTVLLTIQSAVLVLLCILVAGLLRSYATVLQRLHELDDGGQRSTPPPFRTASGVIAPASDPAPRRNSTTAGDVDEWGPAYDLTGTGLGGEIISIRTVQTDFDTVLVFLSSGCAGCGGFWDDLAHRREAALVGSGRLLVVTKGPEAESPGLLAELCPPGVDLVMSTQGWTDYAVPGSPYVVVVDGPSGRIKGEGSGTSLTQVSGLVHQSLMDGSARGTGPLAKPRSDADREVDVDRVLLSAGISPGHPSLYGTGEHRPAPAAAETHFIGWPGVPAQANPGQRSA